MATTNDIKNGMVLDLDGQLWSVVWFQHHKPGKGGAMVKTTLKNVMSGKTVDKTFNAGLKIETANVDKRDFQYLYHDGDSYVFMDKTTYDQVNISEAVVGDYLRHALHYELDAGDLEGLRLFYRLAVEEGLLERERPLEYAPAS